jgi:hypothetical protein
MRFATTSTAMIALCLAGTAGAQQGAAPAAGQSATPPAATAPADPDQRIRCRNLQVTGTVAQTVRACRTVAEWRRLRTQSNDDARSVVDNNRSRPGGQ